MKSLTLATVLLCGLVACGHARVDPQKAKAIAKQVADVTSRTGVNWITTTELRVSGAAAIPGAAMVCAGRSRSQRPRSPAGYGSV